MPLHTSTLAGGRSCAPGGPSSAGGGHDQEDEHWHDQDGGGTAEHRVRARRKDQTSGDATGGAAEAHHGIDDALHTRPLLGRSRFGAIANIPAMCMLITKPIKVIDDPAWFMCTGVIDISPTIANWASARPEMPMRARGVAHRTRQDGFRTTTI